MVQGRWLGRSASRARRVRGVAAADVRLLADLGEADPNVSHIWRNHLAFVEDRLNAPPSATNDRWLERFAAGRFVGGGLDRGEQRDASPTSSPGRRDGDRWLITGAKFYATGSLYADWLDVLGRDDGGILHRARPRATTRASSSSTTGTGFGQQTTASGSAPLPRRPRPSDADVFPAADRFVYQGALLPDSRCWRSSPASSGRRGATGSPR